MSATQMTNKDLIRGYYDRVFNGRQVEAISGYWADPAMCEAVTRGCLSYFDSFPDMHISLDELIAEDDRVFVRSTMTGTHDGEYKGIAPTGRNVAAECGEVYRVSDGKITGYWCLLNVAGLMRQLTEERVAVAGPS
jgi:predicted ester cyclase